MDGEKLVVCRRHWLTFVVPAVIGTLFLVLGIVCLTEVTEFLGEVIFLLLVGIGILAHTYFSYKTTYVMLTKEYVLARRGIIFRNVQVIPRIQVRGIQREYTYLGLLFGYRTIKIRCWGEDRPDISFKCMVRTKEFAEALTGRKAEEQKFFK